MTFLTITLDIVFTVIAPIMLIVGLGYLIGKQFTPDPRSLSIFLIYLFTPALVFKGIYEANLSGEFIGVAVVVVGVAVTMSAIGWLIARLLRYSSRDEGALVLSISMTNAANYGISFNTFAFGTVGGSIAIFYYVISAIVSNISGVFFASRGNFSVRDALLNIIKVPILYAALIGLIFNVYQMALPLIIQRSVIELAAPAAIPLMLALLGLQLARVSFTIPDEDHTLATDLRVVSMATILKLLIAPLVAIGFASLAGLSGLAFKVAVLESSMPTAVLASALATQFGADARFVSAVTLASTMLSIISLSLLLVLLGGAAT